MMATILLSMISSCTLPKADTSLTGQIYLNEQTQDKIEFPKKGTVTFTWASDQGIRRGDYIKGFQKDYPHKFSYAVYDADRKMEVCCIASELLRYFLYETMEISDSEDSIIVTRYDGRKELFMREN